MHFRVLYVMKGRTLNDTTLEDVRKEFDELFCYNCGETEPVREFCDWFQIGGRWNNTLVATKGILGESSWVNDKEPIKPDHYSICEIKDLTQKVKKESIAYIADKEGIWDTEADEDKDGIKKWLIRINGRRMKGVVAVIDCHD